ncbi:MAG TPA: O-antigen ligase family protein [Gaiellales bacterium]|nr:O-antigen ligase family protein [Gaiellales bacterium]
MRAVTASLRDAAGGWPAALWLGLAAIVAIAGAGGASSGGIAMAAAACLGACVLAGVATAGGLRTWAPPPRRVLVYLGALAAVGLVSYASIWWSLTPQASYADANRWLVAAAAAAAGVVVAGLLRRPLEAAVWVLCAASLPLIAYGIQQRAHGEFFQTSPRLQGVLGYPNAIGAYAALAAPGALWLASSTQRLRRAAGAATLALLVLGLALASSRGGMLAALIGCGIWLAVSDRRTESGAALIVVLAASAPVARWGLDQPSFKALDVPFTVPAGSSLLWYSVGAVLGAALLAPAAVELAQYAGPRIRRGLGLAVLALGIAGALLAAVTLSSQHGGPGGALSHVWHQLSGGGAVGSTDHLTQLSTNLRGRWWGEAWDAFRAHPWRGNGAGTFETIDRLARPGFQQAGQEHSAFLHVLSGTGLLGAIPAAIALAAAAACIAAVTRLRGSERAAALALAAGVGAFGLHNQIDWEWQQTALTVLAYPIPVLIACAATAGTVAARAPSRGRAVLVATALALAVIPVTLPVLSNNALDRANRLDNQGRVDEARVEADLGAALDRTSVDAQLERASLLQSLGRPADARRAVDHALSLAPKDDRTWLALAGYQRWCWGDKGWRASLDRARQLSGHDNVFAGSDDQVIAASDACPSGG